MPKLLDYMKKKGYSQKQVIELLERIDNSEEEEIEESEEDIEESEEEEAVQEEVAETEEEIEESRSLTDEELNQKIDDRIRKYHKIKRKVPSKGKIVKKDEIQKDKDVVKKNWFEVMV